MNDTITITSDAGYLGEISLDVDHAGYISLDATDEEGTHVGLGLDLDEAEQLIAKLAVKVAQARMAR